MAATAWADQSKVADKNPATPENQSTAESPGNTNSTPSSTVDTSQPDKLDVEDTDASPDGESASTLNQPDESISDPETIEDTVPSNRRVTLDRFLNDVSIEGARVLRPDVRNGLIRVAALPFGGSAFNQDPTDDGLKRALGRQLSIAVGEQPHVLLIPTGGVEGVFKSFERQELDLTESRAISMGRLLGARYLFLGTLDPAEEGAGMMRVRVRVLSMKRRGILFEKSTLIRSSELANFESYALNKVTRTGALWRSAVFPGWGQLYQGNVGGAVAFMSLGLGTLAGGILSVSEGQGHQDKYEERLADTILYRDRANQAYIRANYFWGAFAGLWVSSLLDAYLNSQDRVNIRMQVSPQNIGVSGAF